MWRVWGTEEVHTGFRWGNLRENERFEDPGIGEKIIVNWIFRKWDGEHGLNRPGSGQGQVSGTCEDMYTFHFDYLAFLFSPNIFWQQHFFTETLQMIQTIITFQMLIALYSTSARTLNFTEPNLLPEYG